MELEEMKKMWQQHDSALQQNKSLSEQIIKSMLKDKSGNIIQRMMNFEYVGMAVIVILLVIYTTMWNNTVSHTNLFICYMFCLIYLIAALILGIYKIQFLSNTDLGSNNITDTMKRIEKFRLIIAKERAWGLMSLPVILFTFYAVMQYWIHKVDLFDNISAYVFQLIVGIITAIVCALALYSKLYFNGIKKIKQNINEIEKFKQE